MTDWKNEARQACTEEENEKQGIGSIFFGGVRMTDWKNKTRGESAQKGGRKNGQSEPE